MKLLKVLSISFLLLKATGCSHTSHISDQQNVGADAVEQWEKLKFGMFIHWGVYSIPAGIWNGEQIPKLGEQIMRHADIPMSEYENVARQFNPINFDADSIVRLAKQAGMKYIVITAKHHDGFCMFESAETDYDIVDFTPYKKDIVKQLAEACKNNGIKLGLYYSTPDWHFYGDNQERNPVDGKLSVFGKVSKPHEEYQVAQLKELLSNYGDIVELFFDMGEPTLEQSKRFAETVRSIQPNCVINGRVMNNQGDFLTMQDNHLPDLPITEIPWEMPGTFYHTWGYKSWVKGDTLPVQIKRQIRTLSRIASMGGNFLLNIGPKSDGSVVPYERQVLEGIGAWMSKNEEAILGTSPNPFIKLDLGRCTRQGQKLYFHVFNWPQNGELVIPGLKNKVLHSYLLADSSNAHYSTRVEGLNVIVDVPSESPDENLPIVVVEYDGDLAIEDPIVDPIDGTITLYDEDAVKYGKYGKVSYKSILRDFYRAWDVSVVKEANYTISMTYRMKYKEKDFAIELGDQRLEFTLTGAGKVSEVAFVEDGNEHATERKNERKAKWHTVELGTVRLATSERLTAKLLSGKEFEFMPTLEEFKNQDQKYGSLKVDVKSIQIKLQD